jgi:transporter family protein
MGWAGLALLSALCAGLTNVLAKVGVDGVPSNLATAVRTVVVLVFAGIIAAVRGEFKAFSQLTSRNWTFLCLSGIATGLSWLFFFAALQRGTVNQVVPIDKLSFVIALVIAALALRERIAPLTMVGAAFILCGVLLTLPGVQRRILGTNTAGAVAAAGPGPSPRS